MSKEIPETEEVSMKAEATGLPYEGVYELKDSVKLMESANHKERFVAEYVQLKIRVERLGLMLAKWEACWQRFGQDECCKYEPELKAEAEKELISWLGFRPTCSYQILERQHREMLELLHTLEVRAAVEGIDLRVVTIKL